MDSLWEIIVIRQIQYVQYFYCCYTETMGGYTVVNEETTRSIADMAKMVIDKFSDGKSQLIFDIPKGNIFGYAPATK